MLVDGVGQPVEGRLTQGLIVTDLRPGQAGPGEQGGASVGGVEEAVQIGA